MPAELALLGPKHGETSYYWEGEDSGLEVRFTNTPRDGILNRTRRTFHHRQEHHGVLATKE